MREVCELIKSLEEKGIGNIELIALVTSTSSEIIFYGDINGRRYQSNTIYEMEDMAGIIDEFYEKVTESIRANREYDENKMNIVNASKNDAVVCYDDKRCRIFPIIHEWESKASGVNDALT